MMNIDVIMRQSRLREAERSAEQSALSFKGQSRLREAGGQSATLENVSRETLEMFKVYARLLREWQKTINLVSESTLQEIDIRHFLDSAQLFKYLPQKPVKLADMGSGAGFPGLVLAMMGAGEVHLIESDVRKATFLREVSRETWGQSRLREAERSAEQSALSFEGQSRLSNGLAREAGGQSAPENIVIIHDDRVEEVAIEGLEVITARALAPLKDLLAMSCRLAAGNNIKCLFLKGEKYKEEIEKAQKRFDFVVEIHPSLSDPAGRVLEISNLAAK